MIGVLVDVSGSMSSAYSRSRSVDRSQDSDDVERIQAVLTTVVNIVSKEVWRHRRDESMFVSAFGIRDSDKSADLLTLLDRVSTESHTFPKRTANITLDHQHSSVTNGDILTATLSHQSPIGGVASLKRIVSGDTRSTSLHQRISHAAVRERYTEPVDSASEHDTAALIDFAERRGYSHIENFIRTSLTPLEAKYLLMGLKSDKRKVETLAELIPGRLKLFLANAGSRIGSVFNQEKAIVEHSAAYNYALQIIRKTEREQEELRELQRAASEAERQKLLEVQRQEAQRQELLEAQKLELLKAQEREFWEAIYQVKPRGVQNVADMMENLLKESSFASASSSTNDKIQEIIEFIRPYIFGGTPMCKALRNAKAMFKAADTNNKVLFILSDGMSTDGDPLPIAKRLRSAGVTIATCYITSDRVQNTNCLLDPRDCIKFKHNSGQQVLMKMSSTMKNTHTPVSYLVDANWELPPSGESCLFVEANSLEVVNEFCRIIVSQLTKRSCDALVDVIGKVPLADYINLSNEAFEPKAQENLTCYAYATATVLHLAMNRIVGREGGIPRFEDVRDRIVNEFGKNRARTEVVLEMVCPEYRLHFHAVDEIGARKAINERRPVIARFSIYKKQREKFKEFYELSPKQILLKSDIEDDTCTNSWGHAVVLMRCDPNCLTFMNSWGTKFADGGFFKVKDENVLHNTKFYDVYWSEEDLTESEKAEYKKACIENVKDLAEALPSVYELPHACPICHKISKVGEFLGHVLEAKCPKCGNTFVPTNAALMESLYLNKFE